MRETPLQLSKPDTFGQRKSGEPLTFQGSDKVTKSAAFEVHASKTFHASSLPKRVLSVSLLMGRAASHTASCTGSDLVEGESRGRYMHRVQGLI